jgi:chromate transporter
MTLAPEDAPADGSAGVTASTPPTPLLLLRTWLSIGIQSFGGGSTTLLLIRNNVVERNRWLTPDEFTRAWAVCQIAPGINLLAATVLIGWRTGGAWGVALSLFGLLLPSVSVTILLTALYSEVQTLPVVQAALRGVIPATVGLGVLLGVRLAQPLLHTSWREGKTSFGTSVAILLGSALLVAWSGVSVLWLIWGAGAVGALSHGLRARMTRRRGGDQA